MNYETEKKPDPKAQEETLGTTSFCVSLCIQAQMQEMPLSEEFIKACEKEGARIMNEHARFEKKSVSDNTICTVLTGLFSNAAYAWAMNGFGERVVKQSFDRWISHVGFLMQKLPEFRSAMTGKYHPDYDPDRYKSPEIRL